jgi:hypothetical protein
MSGGGGESKSTSTQQAQTGPPQFIEGYLQTGINNLVDLYNKNPNAPAYFPGSTVAPFSSTTEQALKALEARGAGGSPLTGAAQTQLTDTITGKYLDPTTNPQFKAALEASHAPYVDEFMGTVIPGITSAFEGSGRTGSPAHQMAVDRATTGLNRTISDADAKAGADYFTTARGQQIAASGMAPTLANQDFIDINQLGTAGQARDNQAQALIDADVAKYNYEQNSQWDYINRYLASLNGGYPGGSSTSSGTTTQQRPQSDGFSSIFGNAMSGAGMFMSMLPMFGISDERLKENITPVGETYDGQDLYLYNLKGDPRPQIGLMAQEVEARNPSAVVEHPSGFKVVNYTKALGLF